MRFFDETLLYTVLCCFDNVFLLNKSANMANVNKGTSSMTLPRFNDCARKIRTSYNMYIERETFGFVLGSFGSRLVLLVVVERHQAGDLYEVLTVGRPGRSLCFVS